MERANTKINKDKTQKESHCEIERKRRERMKLETEYLHRQVPDSHCKDKLSIFLAGAERLIHYTGKFNYDIIFVLEKLGKRDYIINDEEYSRIIMNNFCGFAVRIRCSDGKILYEENAQIFLGSFDNGLVGKTIYQLVEPSSDTMAIILNSLTFYGAELNQAKSGELIPRNFVLSLRCGQEILSKHCVRGSDGEVYRFIEFCGDLLFENDDQDHKSLLIFRGLCRPLDPACTTIISQIDSPKCFIELNQEHVTLRLADNDFIITEVMGNSNKILGWPAKELLRKHLEDFVLTSERNTIKQAIQEAIRNKSNSFKIHWSTPNEVKVNYLHVHLEAICVNAYLYCIVCKLYLVNHPTNGSLLTHQICIGSNGINYRDCDRNLLDDTKEEHNSYVQDPSSLTSQLGFVQTESHHDLLRNKQPYVQTILPSNVVIDDHTNGAYEQTLNLVNSNNDVENREASINQEPNISTHSPNLDEDWHQLPINPSLDQVLSATDLPDLFHPDYLKDLIQEDITDL